MANIITELVEQGLTPHKALVVVRNRAEGIAEVGRQADAEEYLQDGLQDYYSYCYQHNVKYVYPILRPIEDYWFSLA